MIDIRGQSIKSIERASALGRAIPIFLFAILINYAIVPAESSAEYPELFSLMVRFYFLLFIAVVTTFYSPVKYLIAFDVAIPISASLLFLFVNFGQSGISNSWIFYVIIIIFGSYFICRSAILSDVYDNLLFNAINLIVFIWVFLFLFQWIYFLIFKDIVEVHNIIFPYSVQRTEIIGGGLIRMGGAHIEPGTYANWLYGLLLIKIMRYGNPFDKWIFIPFMTLPLSGSFWGILAAAFYVLAYLLFCDSERLRTAIFSIGTFLVIFLIVYITGYADGFIEYTLDRSTLADNSSQAKVNAYNGFWYNFEEYIFFGRDYLYDFCFGCYSPQDAGVFLNSIVRFGFFPALILFGIVFNGVFRVLGARGLLFVLPALFSKWYYWDNIFWLVIFFANSSFVRGNYPQYSVQNNPLR